LVRKQFTAKVREGKTDMHPEFWLERWRNGTTGWHQDRYNAHLESFWQRTGVEPGSQVFVPMCGKTLDMLWLAGQGHRVLGVELSELAVEAFFSENKLPAERDDEGRFVRWRSGEIEILQGDFFDLDVRHLAEVGAVFDRASLVAMPPEMREVYAKHLMARLPASVPVLLVTMEYPQGEMQGPPFSVEESEVRALYEGHYRVEPLFSADMLEENPALKEKGLTRMQEKVFLLSSM
jgi:thiopurine S-methyltransferase